MIAKGPNLKVKYLDNTLYKQHQYFPYPVRNSAAQRIKRHSLYFSIFTGLMSFSYFGFKLDFFYALKKASMTFFTKGLISIPYFYTYEVINSWLHDRAQAKNRQMAEKQQQYYVSQWRTNIYTAISIFPCILMVSQVFSPGLTFRQKVVKSMAEGILLALYSKSKNASIDYRRKHLLSGKIPQSFFQVIQNKK